MYLCVAFFPLRRSPLRQSSCSLRRCRLRRKCAVVAEALSDTVAVDMADSLVEAGLAATWVAATLSAACTPVRALRRAASIEDLLPANLRSVETASVAIAFVKVAFANIASVTTTIAFAIGASMTSTSGDGVDGLGGLRVPTIRTGGILVHPMTRTGPAKSNWQTR